MRVIPDEIINGFDSSYYLLTQPDVAAAGIDPLDHFKKFGRHEGRSPNALFDPAYYLAQNSDVAAAGVDPLQHYLAFGASEGRNPSALLNSSAYLAANPDVAAADVNPLQHYLQFGAFEGRSGGANLTVGTSGNDYLIGTSGNDGLDGGAGNDFVIAAGGNDTANGGDGIDTARFSSNFSDYTFTFVENQVIVDGPEGHDVYTNFERFAFRDGTIERNDSNPLIDDLYYYANSPDVWAAGMDAATHYAQFGWHEGRNPNQYFDTDYYLSNNPDVAAAGVDPLQHFLTFGGFEGRNPSALFDGAAYLALNPDVANAHVNPLLHFLQNGQSEGRSPVVPLFGDANPNSLVGTAGSDSLYGLGGNDQLQGLGGNDLLDGGTGFDRAIYTDAASGITVNLAVGTIAGAGVGSDMLRNIEGVIGSDFADSFNATGFAGVSGNPGGTIGFNDFEGRGGDDVIIGGINGQGQALTRVSYLSATGAVTVDIAAGTAGGDASVGHDAISNIAGIWGSNLNDTLLGSNTAFGTFELFEGRGGDDFIDGLGGYDQVAYNSDPATTSGINVLLAAGTVTGTGGDTTVGTDTIRGVEAVRGTNFDDVYNATGFGSVGANIGSSGNFNEFVGGGGNDTVTGNGFTRLGYSNAIGAVTVDLDVGTATGAGEGTDTFTGVNAVQGSVFADTLSGSSVSNTFTGLGGDDFIDGRGGFDTASYNSLGLATAGVSVSLADGIATGDASIGTDTLRNIEGVQGTGFADTFNATGYGLGGANVSTSNGNFNQFEGLGGDDSIIGNGSTQVAFYNATGTVSVDLQAGSATGNGSVGHDTFIGVNSVAGSNFDDTYVATGFTGTSAAGSFGTFNQFQGQGGDDTITGNGNTQVLFFNATGGVTVDLATGNVNGNASVGHDTITGGVNGVFGSNFNDTISGGNGNEFLHGGNGGNDTINGGGGNDTINGGGGFDNLTGGAGNDNFIFASGSTANATITDFAGNGASPGDTLQFHGFGQAADGATLTLLSGNQYQVQSGLDDHIELITIIGSSVDVSDYQFLI